MKRTNNLTKFPSFGVDDLPAIDKGEKPTAEHILIPIFKSMADASLFVVGIASLAFSVKYLGFMKAIFWIDIIVVGFFSVPFFTLIDYHFFGNSSIFDLHTTPRSLKPEIIEKESENITHTLSLDITQENRRKRIVINVLPDNWVMDQLVAVASSIKSNSMAFSQPVTGLSSHSFGKLRTLWIDKKLIELQSGYEDRYQLTSTGIALIESLTDSDPPTDECL